MINSSQEEQPSLQIGMFDNHTTSRRCEMYIVINFVQ